MLDLALIHPPSVFDFRHIRSFTAPMAEVIPSTGEFDMYPIGITSIAAYLEGSNYSVRVVNLAQRMVADRAFDPVAHLRRLRARVYGIDLHWLAHAQGALATARVVKHLHPKSRVLVGGLSATYYHRELMEEPAIDFVLRGDSTEEPCRRLLACLDGQGDLVRVPNLDWRDARGEVVTNELSYVPQDLDRFDLPAYRYVLRSVFNHGHLKDALPYAGWLREPLTVLLNARGCIMDCATCGGSKSSYRAVCSRERLALRSPERLVQDLRDIRSFSRSPIFMVHDPRVGGYRRAERIFDLFARENLHNELVMELFFPAGPRFFQMVGDSLRHWSLQITLETQDPELRRRNGKFGFPNQRVEETIALALEHGCHTVDVFFMVGIPGQTYPSALGIGDYVEHLLEKLGAGARLRPFVAPLAPFLDPGSRAYEDPALGYRKHALTLADHAHLLLAASWANTLSFEPDAMSRDELVEATYSLTDRLNDLNLAFGLIGAKAHDEVRRGLKESRTPPQDGFAGRRDRAWSYAKDEMTWPGPSGVRPTPRLAWLLATGFTGEVRRMTSRALGRRRHPEVEIAGA